MKNWLMTWSLLAMAACGAGTLDEDIGSSNTIDIVPEIGQEDAGEETTKEGPSVGPSDLPDVELGPEEFDELDNPGTGTVRVFFLAEGIEPNMDDPVIAG